MKDYFTLSIPSPCQESWENFRRTYNGGFCASCKKEVIDFTSWSEREIKAYFRESNGSACGRFKSGQLKTYHVDKGSGQKAKLLPFSFFSMTLLLAANESEASEVKHSHQAVAEFSSHRSESIAVAGDSMRITITGVVIDEVDNIPMPGVNVILKNTVNGTVTDANGRFAITISNPEKNNVLVFSFIGCETVEQSVNNTTRELKVILPPDHEALNEVIIVGGVCARPRWTPGGIWWRIKNIFR